MSKTRLSERSSRTKMLGMAQLIEVVNKYSFLPGIEAYEICSPQLSSTDQALIRNSLPEEISSKLIFTIPMEGQNPRVVFKTRKSQTDDSYGLTLAVNMDGTTVQTVNIPRDVQTVVNVVENDAFDPNNNTLKDKVKNKEICICVDKSLDSSSKKAIEKYFQDSGASKVYFHEIDTTQDPFESVEQLSRFARGKNFDRRGVMIAIGNSAVQHIVGVTARTFRRGAEYVVVPLKNEDVFMGVTTHPRIQMKNGLHFEPYYPPQAIVIDKTRLPGVTVPHVVPKQEKSSYQIKEVKGLLDPENPTLKNVCSSQELLIVLDRKFYDLNKEQVDRYIAQGFQRKNIRTVIIDGEDQNKNKEQMNAVLQAAQGMNDPMIVTFGGGVVLDIAGLAAALIDKPYVRVATTLLAVIDAAIGIKTGINMLAKNDFGAFYMPHEVLYDTSLLTTESRRNVRSGLAEMIKMFIVSDQKSFRMLFECYQDFIERNFNDKTAILMVSAIYDMMRELQPNIYENKTLERVADYGHEFGHILEHGSHYALLHGEAVSLGMAIATIIAYHRGLLKKKDSDDILDLLGAVYLPLHHSSFDNLDNIVKKMEDIKAQKGGDTAVVAPSVVGEGMFIRDVTKAELELAFAELKKRQDEKLPESIAVLMSTKPLELKKAETSAAPKPYKRALLYYNQLGDKKTLSVEEFQALCEKIKERAGIHVMMWFLDIYNSRVMGGQGAGIQAWSNTSVPFSKVTVPVQYGPNTLHLELVGFGEMVIDDKGMVVGIIPKDAMVSTPGNYKGSTIIQNPAIVGTHSEGEQFLSDVMKREIPRVPNRTKLGPVFGGNFFGYVEKKHIFDPQLYKYLKIKNIAKAVSAITGLLCNGEEGFSTAFSNALKTEQINQLSLQIQDKLLSIKYSNPALEKLLDLKRLPHLQWDELKDLMTILSKNTADFMSSTEWADINNNFDKMSALILERNRLITEICIMLNLKGSEIDDFKKQLAQRDSAYAYHDNRRTVILNDQFSISPNDTADLIHKLITRIPDKLGNVVPNTSDLSGMFEIFATDMNSHGYWVFQGAATKAASHPEVQHWHYIETKNKFGQTIPVPAENAEVGEIGAWKGVMVERLNFPSLLYRFTISKEIRTPKILQQLAQELKSWEQAYEAELSWSFKMNDNGDMTLYAELRGNEAALKRKLGEENLSKMKSMGMMGSVGLFGQSTTPEVVFHLKQLQDCLQQPQWSQYRSEAQWKSSVQNPALNQALQLQVDSMQKNFVKSGEGFRVNDFARDNFESRFMGKLARKLQNKL